MLKFLNVLLVMSVLLSAFFLYSLEHSTRGQEREIARINSEIEMGREAIKLLNAEWSSLTRPQRIQELAMRHLKLQNTSAQQYVSTEDLLTRVPESPPVKLEEQGKDPIGDILLRMQ